MRGTSSSLAGPALVGLLLLGSAPLELSGLELVGRVDCSDSCTYWILSPWWTTMFLMRRAMRSRKDELPTSLLAAWAPPSTTVFIELSAIGISGCTTCTVEAAELLEFSSWGGRTRPRLLASKCTCERAMGAMWCLVDEDEEVWWLRWWR